MTNTYFEIISNEYNADFNPINAPEMADLINSMELVGLNPSLSKFLYSVEEEVNMASGKFAQGITVKQTRTRSVTADSVLSSSLKMAKKVISDYQRGLHLGLKNLTSPSYGFIITQICLREGFPVFISGLDKDTQTRMSVKIDTTFSSIPVELEGRSDLLELYYQKSKRKTSFETTIRAILNLPVLPKPLHKKCQEMLFKQSTPQYCLTDPEIINILLIAEYVSRYQSGLNQVFELLQQESIPKNTLHSLFSFITDGISYKIVRSRLEKLTHEDWTGKINSKSTLIDAVYSKIRELKKDSTEFRQFKAELEGLFYFYHFQEDPKLRQKVIFLESKTSEQVEFYHGRKSFYAQFSTVLEKIQAATSQESNEHNELPKALKVIIFIELLNLFFVGRFRENREGIDLTSFEILARETLQAYQLFCMMMIDASKIAPTKNVLGLAQVYADKYPIRWGEIPLFTRTLQNQIHPYKESLEFIRDSILNKQDQEDTQRITSRAEAYLLNSFSVLPKMQFEFNFPPEMNRFEENAIFASTSQLGLNYHLLKNSKSSSESINPISISAKFYNITKSINGFSIYKGYQQFIEQNVVSLYKKIIQGKLDLLKETHNSQLFFYLYSQIINQSIYIDYHQFASILYKQGILKKDSLAKYGYQPDFVFPNPLIRDRNYILKNYDELPEKLKGFFSSEQCTKRARESVHGFSFFFNLIKEGVRKSPSPAEVWLIKQIFRLHKDNIFDLQDIQAKEVFSQNEYTENFWTDTITFLSSQEESFKKSKQTTQILYLSPEFGYLSYFRDSSHIEIKDKTYQLLLECNLDKKSEHFDPLSTDFNSFLKNQLQTTLRPLKRIGRIIEEYQGHWMKVQRSTALYLIKEIYTQTSLEEINRDVLALSEIYTLSDSDKLVIGPQANQYTKSNFKNIFQEIPEPANNTYITINDFFRKVQQIEKMSDTFSYYQQFLQDLDQSFSQIPHIRQAPKPVKYMRKQIRELKALYEIKVENITFEEVEVLQKTSFRLIQNFRNIQEEEGNSPMRYRFVTRALTKFQYMRPNNLIKDLYQFFKQTSAENREGKSYKTFTAQLKEIVQFQTLLQRKQYFFVYAKNAQLDITKSCIENILFNKGWSSNIYVHFLHDDEFFFESMLDLIPPQRIIPFH
ncbi:MAG: hypothetical protein ACI86H_000870 [bacterium]|jgi:hypothetical protein